MASSSSNVVGVHYRVGKKIGEGSFGVIFEGTNLLNNQQVAIKFVRRHLYPSWKLVIGFCYTLFKSRPREARFQANISTSFRNHEKVMPHNYEMSIEHIKFLLAAVSISLLLL
jgi:serine/threonine protein kinase